MSMYKGKYSYNLKKDFHVVVYVLDPNGGSVKTFLT